jgi:hypothetical protein
MKRLLVPALALGWTLALAADPVAPAGAPAKAGPPEPQVLHIVVEDDRARIEELRVRGQTTRVVVKPKHAAEYEIVPAASGRDPSQNRGGTNPGAGGQRVWNLLRF